MQNFKSLKDFKKSYEFPRFKFSSDIVKDIINPKSKMYTEPHSPTNEPDKGNWHHRMKALKHPDKI